MTGQEPEQGGGGYLMSRYADIEKVIEDLEDIVERGFPSLDGTHAITAERVLERLKGLTKIKAGHWIHENLRQKTVMFDCSVCGKTCYDLSGRWKHGEKSVCNYRYCPWCGAKMDERFGNSEQLEE